MVTVDPVTHRGEVGNGADYIVEGSIVGFYVAGFGKDGQHIIARATVANRIAWSSGKGAIDPQTYPTEPPDQVLELRDIAYFDPPIDFRAALPDLTIRPKNMK